MRQIGSKLIVVIDDSDDNRTLLETFLGAHGWRVYGAANGREALSLLRELRRLPDLILLDLEMPVMNGVQFRVEQMRDERLKRIPVVVMSATSDEVILKELCPDGILPKPFTVSSIVERLADFF